MATKIVTKNSSTASAVPTASDLVQGELAVNVSDKRLFTEDNGGSIVELGTNPSTIDINAGTIDGAVIGGNTPAAITGSTVTSTGNIVVTGTVDGRDVATDGTKLDGIEASADVTDTTNVTAAGALMDSEVTNLAQVKAFDSADYATAAQGTLAANALPKAGGAMTGAITTNSTFDGRDVAADGTKLDGIEAGATIDQTAAEIKTAYESNSDTNAFTDADHTKLDGIEASADVTDTANVTAAGALMDSELTSIASVKALNQGVATGDSPTFAGGTFTGTSYGQPLLSVDNGSTGGYGAYIDTSGFTNAHYALSVSRDGGKQALRVDGLGDVAFYEDTGTTAKFFWDASAEYLGIGTSSPSRPLTVSAWGEQIVGEFINQTASQTARIYATCGTASGWIQQNGNTHATDPNTMHLTTTTGDITITPSYVERVRVTAAGKVGLGTSSPASKLHLADTSTVVTFEDTDSTNNSINTITNYEGTMILSVDPNNNSTVTESMRFSMLGTERMRISSAGRVGIGTSTPLVKTHIATNVSAGSLVDSLLVSQNTSSAISGQGARILLSSLNASNRAAGIAAIAGSSSNHALAFYTNGNFANPTEKMRIDSSGKVGIGTSSPSAPLSVVAASGAVPALGAASSHAAIGSSGFGTMIGTKSTGVGYIQQQRFDGTATSYSLALQPNGGNVGIGTSIPTYPLDVDGAIRSNNYLYIKSPTSTAYEIRSEDNYVTLSAQSRSLNHVATRHIFLGADFSERMRVDTSGNLLVGGASINAFGSFTVRPNQNNGSCIVQMNRADTTATSVVLAFYNNNSIVGTITHNNTATSYNTSSDQRLKDNIADADDAGSKIDSIQVRKYDWKADGSHQDYGMVAQELQLVAPEAVSVPEDSEEMMGVDYSKLVPMLIKEIQSLRNRVAQLETGE
tara:strand:- start:5867 stop:8608 length:2742 start_codon:yes stop_codon:yes gene_type:complete